MAEKIEKPVYKTFSWNSAAVSKWVVLDKTEKYDERGNIIHSKDSDGNETWHEHDAAGNKTCGRHSDSNETWLEREFHRNRKLKKPTTHRSRRRSNGNAA